MFEVNGLGAGDCDADDKHTGREVLLVEDQMTGQELKLCQGCLMAQLELRTKGEKAAPAVSENGRLPMTT